MFRSVRALLVGVLASACAPALTTPAECSKTCVGCCHEGVCQVGTSGIWCGLQGAECDSCFDYCDVGVCTQLRADSTCRSIAGREVGVDFRVSSRFPGCATLLEAENWKFQPGGAVTVQGSACRWQQGACAIAVSCGDGGVDSRWSMIESLDGGSMWGTGTMTKDGCRRMGVGFIAGAPFQLDALDAGLVGSMGGGAGGGRAGTGGGSAGTGGGSAGTGGGSAGTGGGSAGTGGGSGCGVPTAGAPCSTYHGPPPTGVCQNGGCVISVCGAQPATVPFASCTNGSACTLLPGGSVNAFVAPGMAGHTFSFGCPMPQGVIRCDGTCS